MCCVVVVPDATTGSSPPCRLSRSPSIVRSSHLLSHTPVYLLTLALPVSSSLSSSHVCTCAPYCCCSIPRHLGSLVPCIPSAAALTTKLSVYSKSTPQQAFCPCHLRARSSFLPAPPRAQESVGAAWLDLAHVRRPPGLPLSTYQSTPAPETCSSSSLLRRHLEEALTRLLITFFLCCTCSV